MFTKGQIFNNKKEKKSWWVDMLRHHLSSMKLERKAWFFQTFQTWGIPILMDVQYMLYRWLYGTLSQSCSSIQVFTAWTEHWAHRVFQSSASDDFKSHFDPLFTSHHTALQWHLNGRCSANWIKNSFFGCLLTNHTVMALPNLLSFSYRYTGLVKW